MASQLPKENIGFCPKCLAETTEESPGDMFTLNFFLGTSLMGFGDQCPDCRSQVQEKWFSFGIPLRRLGRYRVIYLDRSFSSYRYIGRKLR